MNSLEAIGKYLSDIYTSIGTILTSVGATATGPAVKTLSATVLNDTGTVITLQVGTGSETWRLVGLRTLHSAGAGATTQPGFHEAVGGNPATPTIDTVYRDTVATVQGVVRNVAWTSGLFVHTDSNGRAYLRSGVNAGNNNTFYYMADFERVRAV